MDERIQRALESDRTIDITTTGRNSGQPRRIEIWMYRYDGRVFLSGSPGTRDWYANLRRKPEFTFHLKGSVQADLPAVARPITDEAERRRGDPRHPRGARPGLRQPRGMGRPQSAGRGRIPLTKPASLPCRAVSSQASAGRRRLRTLVLGTAAIAALAAAGCGEKPEPSIHPPTTTAATTTTPTTTAPAPTTTKPAPTPTAPVPKTTP